MSDALTRERAADPAPTEVSVNTDPSSVAGSSAGRRRALPMALQAGAPAWIWIGIAVAAIGFILIAVGWGQVAGESQVYRQLPYLVSAALVGLGLVLLGLTVLNIASRQRDGLDRDRQIAALVAIIEELHETLGGRERP